MVEEIRRRREFVPGASAPVEAPGEDVQLALDTIERRIAHLSTLINPPPGRTQHRTAHWRDEVELRSLRLAVRALHRYRAEGVESRLLALLGRLEDRLRTLRSSDLLPLRQKEQVERMIEDIETTVEEEG